MNFDIWGRVERHRPFKVVFLFFTFLGGTVPRAFRKGILISRCCKCAAPFIAAVSYTVLLWLPRRVMWLTLILGEKQYWTSCRGRVHCFKEFLGIEKKTWDLKKIATPHTHTHTHVFSAYVQCCLSACYIFLCLTWCVLLRWTTATPVSGG